MTTFISNDGGRAGHFSGTADDCVTRAIAIATETPYLEVRNDLRTLAGKFMPAGRFLTTAMPRRGVSKKIYKPYLEDKLGWIWTPTMGIGTGCQVHLRPDELPTGRLVVRLSRHLTAVIDGIVHDTHNPSRDGTRCVYGYWTSTGLR